MKISRGLTILFVLFGSSLGRPSLEEKEGGGGDATTTPESIEKIFHKYNQQYPFHGGPVPEDQAELQNDEPVMEAIIERLNEIINDDKPSDFLAPSPDATLKQRSLLRKQNEELVFGSVHLNRRVVNKEPVNRGNSDLSGVLDLNQINKDLLADSHRNRQTGTRKPSRIPVRVSTRFPTRRPTTSTTTYAPDDEDDSISDLVADSLLGKRPEANKLSVPVLSVATEDFEEDIPQKPVVHHHVRPNKVSAQTDDFEDPHHRERRESESSYSWLLNKVSYWFNFYGEPEGEEATGEARKMSTLSKRQLANETENNPEPVPVPEQVKSVDVPSQIADAVLETILDIDDKQTRQEFAKDVPAIEDKLDELEEQEEANKTVEVAIVSLGDTEPERLGTVIEDVTTAKSIDHEIVIEDVRPEVVDPELTVRDVVPEIHPAPRNLNIPAEEVPVISEVTTEPAEPQMTTTMLDLQPEIREPVVRDEEGEEIDPASIIPTTEGTPTEDVIVLNTSTVEIITKELPMEPIPTIVQDEVPFQAAEPSPVIPEAKPIDSPPAAVIPEEEAKSIVDTSLATDQLEITVPEIPAAQPEPEIAETPLKEEIPGPISPVEEANVTDATRILIENKRATEIEAPSSPLDSIPSEMPVPQLTNLEIHPVEEVVLLTDNIETPINKPIEEVPVVISEEAETIQTQTISPVTVGDNSSSGSDSQSMSTTESTQGSSEEEDCEEKIAYKEEKRLRKEEKERLKKEEKQRKKDLKKKDGSSEEDEEKKHEHHIHLDATLIEPEEKMSKEQMVNIFSSPENEEQPQEERRLDTEVKSVDPAVVISEVTEIQKNVSSDHVVIKKDGVPPAPEEDSVESDEDETAVTAVPEVIAELDAALEKEIQTVQEVLTELQNAIEDMDRVTTTSPETTETAFTEAATESVPLDPQSADVAELTNSVVSSKNTRHLIHGYNGADYFEKDTLPDGAARLAEGTAEGEKNTSRAFIVVGSALFLITGFILFALVVVLVKRSGRHGSLDLTIEP